MQRPSEYPYCCVGRSVCLNHYRPSVADRAVAVACLFTIIFNPYLEPLLSTTDHGKQLREKQLQVEIYHLRPQPFIVDLERAFSTIA